MAEALTPHPACAVVPSMSPDEYQALVEDIRRYGQIEPIVLYQGQILDGRHRHMACDELGIQPKFEHYRGECPVQFVSSSNTRRDLTKSQRACMAVDWLPMLEAEAKERQKMGMAKLPDPSEAGPARDHAAGLAGTSPRYVSDAKRLKAEDPDAFERVRNGSETLSGAKRDVIALKHTGDQESYTPSDYIELARGVMGGIDIDPASNEHAQQVVRADQYFTAEQNGLSQHWAGRVWLNPPYAFPVIEHFVTKLCKHVVAGDIEQAILLTNNSADTKWWHNAARHSSVICQTLGRVNFYKGDGRTTQPTNGQTFFYFGDSAEDFACNFSDVGILLRSYGDS